MKNITVIFENVGKLPIYLAIFRHVKRISVLFILTAFYLSVFIARPAFAATTPIFSPVDTIIGGQLNGTSFETGAPGSVVGDNNWPSNEGPEHLLDGVGQKYLNFGEFNTGVIVTPVNGCSIVDNMKFWPANDARPRDPTGYKLYGTNEEINGSSQALSLFTLISEGNLTLPNSRNSGGNSSLSISNLQAVSFTNTAKYESYLLLFPDVKNSNGANSMQIAEVQLFGSIESCVTPIIPKIEYRFDEFIWNGTTDEVFDSSENNYHGTAVGGVSTVAGKICNAASIPSNNNAASVEAVNTGVDLDTVIGSIGSISFWYKANSAWNSGSDKRLFDATDGNKYFFADISNGKIKFWFEEGNDGDYQKTTVDTFIVDAGEWKYLSFAWDVTNSIAKIFVDGVEQALSGGNGGTTPFTGYDTLYFGDNRDGSYFTGESSADGLIDEVLIFDSVISESQVEDIFDYQKGDNNNNYDGTPRVCPIPPVPLLEYRFDETSWSGTSADVLDTSGNSLHGTATNVQPVSGLVCNAADFDRSNRIEAANNALLEVGENNADYTVNFWLNPRSITNDWSNIIHKGSVDLERTFAAWFWLNESRIAQAISTTSNSNEFHSSTALGLNSWTMVTLVKQGDQMMTYLNGILVTKTTLTGSSKSNSGPLYIGDDPWYTGIDALMDELIIFGSALNASEVKAIHINNLAGNGWDGSERNCPITSTLLAEYRFEGDTWNDTPSVIIDNTGNGYHGEILRDSTLVSSATAQATATAALTGNPGTCGYASQTSGSIEINDLDLPSGVGLDTTTVGAKTTVTFWMHWDGTKNSIMPIGWYIHDIWMTGGNIGFNTGGGDLHGTSSAVLANGWHHIAAEFTNGSVSSNKIYIDGEKVETLTDLHSGRTPNDSRAYVDSEMRIGGWSVNTGYDFYGLIDEVRVYKGVLTTDQVVTIMNERHDCNTPVIHHYEINHDGQGLTCQSEDITITAHDANHNPVAPSNSTIITLSTSIVNDGWTLKSGSGSFNGTASYTFSGSENLAVFGLSKITATTSPHIDIDVTDGTSTDLDGDLTEDKKLVFDEAGFLVSLANHQSCTTPNLTIKAVKLSDSGLECAPAYTGNQSVDFIFNYANPTSGSKIPSLAGDVMEAATVTQNRTINFDNTGTADLSFNYQDAGQISIKVSDGASAGLTSSTVTTVVSPAKLIVASSDANADCASGDASCLAFKAAGAPFNLAITAACSDNTVTTNFEMDDIPLTVSTIAPNVGNSVSLGVTSIDMSAVDNGIHSENNQTVSEVGVFTITATPLVNGYFGETIPVATSANIGRFIPDHFDVSITNNSFEDTCTTGTSDFTYIGQPFTYLNAPELLITAKNVSGVTTQNYTETGYQKLTSASVVRTFPIADTSKDGTITGTKMVVSAVTSDGNLTTPTSVPSSNSGEMTYTFDSSDSFTYSKNANSEVEFFTATYDIIINSIQDSDSANASTSLAFTVPSTNTVSPTGVNLRSGRWNIDNTFGPETSDLPVPMAIQYWDGSNYVINTLDNCTTFDSDNVANYSLTLNDLNNPLSASNLTPISGSGNFALGLAELKIGKPTDGSQGQIRLTYDTTPAWLQYDWDWNGVEVKTFDENPSGIATFGLFRGNDRIIYNREVYN